MNKPQLLIIAGIALLIVGLFVGLGRQSEVVNQSFGYGGYNELGNSGLNATSVVIGDTTGNEPLGSTTAFKILAENWGRQYAEIILPFTGALDMRLYFGTNTNSLAATSTLAASTDVWEQGITFATDSPWYGRYIIDGDNLWKGEVWGIASTASGTIETFEK